MIFKAFDVVKVPFPFTDSGQSKKRPALVLSSAIHFGNLTGHSVLAMITSRKNVSWALDVPILHIQLTGLTADSVVRMKLFTLDHRFILEKMGTLHHEDTKNVQASLSQLFDFIVKI